VMRGVGVIGATRCSGCPACRVRCGGKGERVYQTDYDRAHGESRWHHEPCLGCRDCLECERCGGRGRIPDDHSEGAAGDRCPNCGGSGIEAPALNYDCRFNNARYASPCDDCETLAECAVPAVPEEGERWEGFAERECGEHRTLGGRAWCYDCSAYCYPEAPCPGCELPVLRSRAEAAERHLAELREEVERVRDFCEDDRVLSMNTMGEKSGAAIAYGIVIERLDAALHPQDSTERTEHG
jgi:hypothetical protein